MQSEAEGYFVQAPQADTPQQSLTGCKAEDLRNALLTQEIEKLKSEKIEMAKKIHEINYLAEENERFKIEV